MIDPSKPLVGDSKVVEVENAQELYQWLKAYSPGTLSLDHMEDAIVGVIPVAPDLYALAYDYGVVLDVLQRHLEMSYDDSVVYFEQQLLPLYENHRNPVFIKAFGGIDGPEDTNI